MREHILLQPCIVHFRRSELFYYIIFHIHFHFYEAFFPRTLPGFIDSYCMQSRVIYLRLAQIFYYDFNYFLHTLWTMKHISVSQFFHFHLYILPVTRPMVKLSFR